MDFDWDEPWVMLVLGCLLLAGVLVILMYIFNDIQLIILIICLVVLAGVITFSEATPSEKRFQEEYHLNKKP